MEIDSWFTIAQLLICKNPNPKSRCFQGPVSIKCLQKMLPGPFQVLEALWKVDLWQKSSKPYSLFDLLTLSKHPFSLQTLAILD